MKPGEFQLIDVIRRRAATREDVVLGIGDDAALLRMPPGRELVVAMDTLNAGVHFPEDTRVDAIGWKSLAVNLSDLAAMGAVPAWCTLSLSLPDADRAWIEAFLDGFFALARQHDVALVGGDTTRGPLSICVTAFGSVEPGRALRRDGARVGDDVWVAGLLGDAAGALAQWRAGAGVDDALRQRLDRPVPLVAVGCALVGVAHACIDVSDGFLADLGHICTASRVAAEIAVDTLPCSTALREAFDPIARRTLQAAGGDDYALCFTAPASLRDAVGAIGDVSEVAMTRVGRIVAGEGVSAFDRDDACWAPGRTGHDHFAD